MKRTTLSEQDYLLETDRGRALTAVLRPNALLFVSSGHVSTEFLAPHLESATRLLSRDAVLHVLVDALDARGADTEYREAWTAWTKKHNKQVKLHILFRSKLIEMAVTLASLVLGSNLAMYSDPAKWERACGQLVPGFRRRALPAAAAQPNPQ